MSPQFHLAQLNKSDHMSLLRDRREWFLRQEGLSLVLWWVKAGHEPDTDEAKQRLALLADQGATEQAFTFSKHFPSPGVEV